MKNSFATQTTMTDYINPNRPTKETPLLERVRWVIGSAEVKDDDTPEWTEEAQAAIQEVATWLEEEFGPQIDWITTELRQEACNG